ncbi:Predicted thiol-disulfide oxidoreductase YuxK, DCC family [Halogranum amylolyticum]|uniref:Predicted thiol-disulfide oxidoreductase YuxK, DCC family n=1 Tax=Halogranum amylolyticum TaxID=660520 RepID=A0A1H8QMX2_9EURY|nr:DCC1-like thiol-disulfide oxidoreductase family protein [Halogranum amylolyticum]SEO55396.1 Predicted thiol-disulfide oxidoreductase YuxK, DCC family [Halogranum amylolyticum]
MTRQATDEERQETTETTPRIVYDDDCGFCTWAAAFADRHGEFELVGFSELTRAEKVRLPANYESCVHLLVDGDVYSCGEATEQVLARLDPTARQTFELLRGVPGYAKRRERLYRWTADRRALWGKILRRDSL